MNYMLAGFIGLLAAGFARLLMNRVPGTFDQVYPWIQETPARQWWGRFAMTWFIYGIGWDWLFGWANESCRQAWYCMIGAVVPVQIWCWFSGSLKDGMKKRQEGIFSKPPEERR